MEYTLNYVIIQVMRDIKTIIKDVSNYFTKETGDIKPAFGINNNITNNEDKNKEPQEIDIKSYVGTTGFANDITNNANQNNEFLATNFHSGGGGMSRQSGFVTQRQAMGYFQGFVYSLLDAISAGVKEIDFQIFDTEDKIIENHPAGVLFNNPNTKQTRSEFISTIVPHLKMGGNAYVYLGDIDSNEQEPTCLIPLSPLDINIEWEQNYNELNTLEENITKAIKFYRYNFLGKVINLRPHQVWHIKCADPANLSSGTGTVSVISQILDAFNNAILHNKRYLENGATVSGVFISGARGSDSLKNLERGFNSTYAGANNARKNLFLPFGMEYKPMGDTPKDMDWGILLDKYMTLIQSAFRVSKVILGIGEAETNRSTAETTHYIFQTRTIKPLAKEIIESFNTYILPRFKSSQQAFLGFEDVFIKDKEFELNRLDKLTAGKQIISQNEARADLDLEPVDDDKADEITTEELEDPFTMPDENLEKKEYNKKTQRKELKKINEKHIVGRYIAPNVKMFPFYKRQESVKNIIKDISNKTSISIKSIITKHIKDKENEKD